MALALSPTGNVLASISQDFTVRLWDLATGKQLRKLDAQQGAYYGVAFAPDGKTLASCGQTIRLWETASYKGTAEFGRSGKWILCVAFAPDSKTLAAGSADGDLRLWDVATCKEVGQFTGHQNHVRSLAFAPDGRTLVSASEDGTLRLWNVATRKQIRQVYKADPNRPCSNIALSSDGGLLAWSSGDMIIRLWEVATAKEIRQFRGSQSYATAVAFSPHGETLVSGGWDCIVQVWQVATGKQIQPTPGHHAPLYSVDMSPDDTVLASAGSDRSILFWDPATGQALRQLRHEGGVDVIAFSPDGKVFSFGGRRDQTIRLSDVATGRPIRRFRLSDERMYGKAFSPDGKTLACLGWAQPIRLWDMDKGEELRAFGSAWDVAFSADGSLLASAEPQRPLQLWDVATGKEVREFNVERSGFIHVALSPDGKLLAAASLDDAGTIRVLKLPNGEELFKLTPQVSRVNRLSFSPDSRSLAVAGEDHSVQVWEVATGKRRRLLEGHQGPVFGLSFSADGRRLASASKDTTVLLWDLTGRLEGGKLRPANLAAHDLDTLWTDLASDDAAVALRAIWTLVAGPRQSVPFLQERMRPVALPDSQQIARWITDLDSKPFAVREQATAELEKLAELAEPALLNRLAEKPPEEVRRRITQLLARLRAIPSGERLRTLRALEALENIGTPEARQLLERLAKGSTAARETQAAKASLQRLAKRQKR
jgi:WD40 repeat protein